MASSKTRTLLAVVILVLFAAACAWSFSVPKKIGDYVWLDTNANGIQDSDEDPVAGVTVELLTPDGEGNWVKATSTTTDSYGLYEFYWNASSYKVRFVLPQGYQFTATDQGSDDSVDSDANPETGETEEFTVPTGGEDLTRDAGLWAPSNLGDYVWEDINGDGIQDADEPGIAGVTLTLEGDTNGDGVSDVSLTTATDQNGYYSFDNLAAGSYVVSVDAGTIPVNFFATYDLDSGTTNPDGIAQADLGFNTSRDDVDFGYKSEGPPNDPPEPAIKLTKTADPTDIESGEQTTYTYVVENIGEDDLRDVVLTDDNATPDDPSDDFIVGTIDLLPVGASQTFTVNKTLEIEISFSTDSSATTMSALCHKGGNGKGNGKGKGNGNKDDRGSGDDTEDADADYSGDDQTDSGGESGGSYTECETFTNTADVVGVGVISEETVTDTDPATVKVCKTIEIKIDIKPGSNPNAVNIHAPGVVPVAILTTDTFDAHWVIPESVRFAGAAPVRWTYEDALVSPLYPDGPVPPSDGDIDLILFFDRTELNLSPDATTATLTGTLINGETFSATDSIKIPGRPRRR